MPVVPSQRHGCGYGRLVHFPAAVVPYAEWAFVWFLPAITTAAPDEAKPFAMPSPIPPFPPTIKATRFCKLKTVIRCFPLYPGHQ